MARPFWSLAIQSFSFQRHSAYRFGEDGRYG